MIVLTDCGAVIILKSESVEATFQICFFDTSNTFRLLMNAKPATALGSFWKIFGVPKGARTCPLLEISFQVMI